MVAEFLKMAQFVDEHRMTQVQVRCGRVETRLDPQRARLGQLLLQILLKKDFLGAPAYLCQGLNMVGW